MAANSINRQNNPTLWAKEMAFGLFDMDEAIRLLNEDFLKFSA